MTKTQVTILDSKTRRIILKKEFESKDPITGAKKFSKMYPDSFVSMTYMEGNSVKSICLSPENSIRDQELVDSGKMTVSAFIKKWHPGKMAKKKDVELELAEEFSEEETNLYHE